MKYVFHYSLIISLFLHILFFTLGIKILNSYDNKDKFRNMKIISISRYIKTQDNLEEDNFKEKEVLKKIDLKENTMEKVNNNYSKPFSSLKNEKPSKSISGGGAEVLTSVSDDSSSADNSTSNFIIQNIPEGKGDGIGDKVSGIGELSSEVSMNISMPKVDKDKILNKYLLNIRAKIEENKVYPELARQEGLQGNTKVEFVIEKDGSISKIKILFSSGHKILDNAAVEAVKKATPFLNIPQELEKENLNVKLQVVFQLQ